MVQVIDFARMIELRRNAGDSEFDKTTAISREIQNASRGFRSFRKGCATLTFLSKVRVA